MPEERIIPRIEPAPMLQHMVADPNPAKQRAILPIAVQNAVTEYHKRIAEAELNKLQSLYAQGNLTDDQILLLVEQGIIQQPKNIFQLLQEKSMEALIAMVWNFIKTNYQTTIAGIAFVLTQLFLKLGFDAPSGFMEVLQAIGYVFIFNLADKKISATWIAGSILAVLSLFFPIIASVLGIASNPLIMTAVQLGVQQLVAFLLKDQPDLQAIARRTGALPNAVPLLVFGLLFFSASAFAQESRCNAIPSSFMVNATEISVRFDAEGCEKENALGLYNHRKALIRLNEKDLYSADRLSETFYHELTHCLLLSTEYDSLSDDERFVSRFSRVLRQAICSFRYPVSVPLPPAAQPRKGASVRRSALPKQLQRNPDAPSVLSSPSIQNYATARTE